MISQKTWIVVADSARARVFTRKGKAGALEERNKLEHEESALHEGDLRTGGEGEVIESRGASSREAEPQVSAKEKHADTFAREIAAHLQAGRNNHEFDELIIVAAPGELGRIRDKLDPATKKFVTRTVDKNWAQHDKDEIEKLLGRTA